MDDEPANTGEGGVPIDNRLHQKMKSGWANKIKEKRNPKRQPDPLFKCDMAFVRLEVTLKNIFPIREQDV